MPSWLTEINSYLKKESKTDSSRFVQLASIGVDNTPRVRTVVFRGWSKSNEMKIITDKRSSKFYELELNNNVEVCWLFKNSRCQFRLRGKSAIDKGIDKSYHWDKLDDNSKSMWSWPAPGEKFILSSFNRKVLDENSSILDNFILLKIDIFHIDQLILDEPYHYRRHWIKKNEWIEERINP